MIDPQPALCAGPDMLQPGSHWMQTEHGLTGRVQGVKHRFQPHLCTADDAGRPALRDEDAAWRELFADHRLVKLIGVQLQAQATLSAQQALELASHVILRFVLRE